MSRSSHAAPPLAVPPPVLVRGRPQCPRCRSRLLFDGEEWTCVACGYAFTPSAGSALAALAQPTRRAAGLLPLFLFGAPLLGIVVVVLLLLQRRWWRRAHDARSA